jgi:hypothetical protein
MEHGTFGSLGAVCTRFFSHPELVSICSAKTLSQLDVVVSREQTSEGFGRTVLSNKSGEWRGGAMHAEAVVGAFQTSRVNVVSAALVCGVAVLCFVVLACLPDQDTQSALLQALKS